MDGTRALRCYQKTTAQPFWKLSRVPTWKVDIETMTRHDSGSIATMYTLKTTEPPALAASSSVSNETSVRSLPGDLYLTHTHLFSL